MYYGKKRENDNSVTCPRRYTHKMLAKPNWRAINLLLIGGKNILLLVKHNTSWILRCFVKKCLQITKEALKTAQHIYTSSCHIGNFEKTPLRLDNDNMLIGMCSISFSLDFWKSKFFNLKAVFNKICSFET